MQIGKLIPFRLSWPE